MRFFYRNRHPVWQRAAHAGLCPAGSKFFKRNRRETSATARKIFATIAHGLGGDLDFSQALVAQQGFRDFTLGRPAIDGVARHIKFAGELDRAQPGDGQAGGDDEVVGAGLPGEDGGAEELELVFVGDVFFHETSSRGLATAQAAMSFIIGIC